MKKLYVILLLALLPLCTSAQSRVSAPTAIWPELQLNIGIAEEGVLFFQNHYRINTDSRYNDLTDQGLLSNFERIELLAGYEQTLSEHWRGGASFRYAAEDFPKTLFYALFLRHTGAVSGLFFNKQAMFEYVSQEQQDAFGRVRLAVDFGKRLPFKATFVTPALSYEAMLLTNFNKNEGVKANERTIDRTRLRLNLTYELTNQLRLTPYFMRQTDYYYVQVPPKYDEAGVLQEEGYTTKRNRIMPVFGLELNYSLNLPPNTASISY